MPKERSVYRRRNSASISTVTRSSREGRHMMVHDGWRAERTPSCGCGTTRREERKHQYQCDTRREKSRYRPLAPMRGAGGEAGKDSVMITASATKAEVCTGKTP